MCVLYTQQECMMLVLYCVLLYCYNNNNQQFTQSVAFYLSRSLAYLCPVSGKCKCFSLHFSLSDRLTFLSMTWLHASTAEHTVFRYVCFSVFMFVCVLVCLYRSSCWGAYPPSDYEISVYCVRCSVCIRGAK